MASGGGGGSSRNDGGGSSCGGGGGGSSCGGGDSAMALIESLVLAARHGSADISCGGGGGGHGGGCGGGGEESRPADHSTHADALPSTRILRRWQHACWGLRGRLGVDRRVVRGGGSMATRSARVPTDQKGELKYTRTHWADESHVCCPHILMHMSLTYIAPSVFHAPSIPHRRSHVPPPPKPGLPHVPPHFSRSLRTRGRLPRS